MRHDAKKSYDKWKVINSNTNKIWVYGDSYSFPTADSRFTQEYYETCESYNQSYHVDKFWFDYIAEKRNLETVIMADGGRSNSWILRSITQTMKYWKSTDEIYIGHTYPHRYEYPNNNEWVRINPDIHEKVGKDVDLQWVNNLYKNWVFSHECQLEFWNNLNDIVSFGHLNGFKIKSWFWGVYDDIIESFANASKDEVGNSHPSPKGSYQLYEIIENLPFGHKSVVGKNFKSVKDGGNLITAENTKKIDNFFKNRPKIL